MNVKSEIKVYSVNGEDAKIDTEPVTISNVWNANRLVEIKIFGTRVQVHVEELRKALLNATGNENLR